MKKIIILILFLSIGVSDIWCKENPEKVVEKVVEYYSDLNTYQDKTEVIMKIESQGIENKMTYMSEIYIEKPNKFAIINKTGLSGRQIISNGEMMWIYLPFMKKYTKTDAPENICDILISNLDTPESMGSEQFLLFLFFNKNNKILQNSSTEIVDRGEEIIHDRIYDIIGLESEDLNLKIWINRRNNQINKINYDMTSLIRKKQQANAISQSEVTMSYTEIHSDIKINQDIQEEKFIFKSAKGIEYTENLYDEGGAEDEYLSPGEKFINFKINSILSKESIELLDYIGKATVLIFWEKIDRETANLLDSLKDIIKEKKDSELAVIGIYETEDEKKAGKEIKEYSVKFPVGIDRNQYVKELYGVNSYPSVFIIDKSGIIRQIYSGYFTGIDDRIKEDLEIIIKGDDQGIEKNEKRGLHKRWHANIRANDLVVCGDMAAAVNSSGKVYFISEKGTIKSIKTCDKYFNRIEKGNFHSDEECEYIAYRTRDSGLLCFNKKGKELWKSNLETGINCIGVINSKEGEFDKLALGSSGRNGLNILGHKGEKIITSTEVINILNIDVYKNIDNSDFEIAVISGSGEICFFNSKGNKTKSFKPDIRPDYLKYLKNSKDKRTLITGNSQGSEILRIQNMEGEVLWEVILGESDNARIWDSKEHPFKEWIAAGTVNGHIYVFDRNGNIVAFSKDQGMNVNVDWIKVNTGEYNLITGTAEKGVNCYIVSEGE
ncbi:MAG: redoxin domain-containing protein [Elusimicrobiota bacterium]